MDFTDRRLRLLLVLLGLLLPFVLTGAVPDPGSTSSVAWAGDDDDEKDPLDDDEGDDFFDTPTSFSKEQAEKAIQKGVTFLKKVQKDDGSWGDTLGNQAYGGGAMQGQQYGHPAGATALALYALLKCKVSLRDPTVKKGFDFLKKRHKKPGGSYETAALLLAVCATANPYKTTTASRKRVERLKLKGEWRRWAQELHKHLLDKKTAQTWRYNVTGQPASPDGSMDLSSTQLAALALFAAHQLKLRAPDGVWEDILEFSMSQQDDDGPEVVTKDPLSGKEIRRKSRGFAYIKGNSNPEEGKATGSMTACGVANIMMARFVLTDAGRKKAEWEEKTDEKRVQRAVDDGIAWIEENWNARSNPRKAQFNVYHLYWMYSVERAMDLIGHQRIGSHFWYSEMGQHLINTQAKDGAWDSNSTHDPRKVLDTCFALLFLKKATQGQIPFPSITGGTDDGPVDNR